MFDAKICDMSHLKTGILRGYVHPPRKTSAPSQKTADILPSALSAPFKEKRPMKKTIILACIWGLLAVINLLSVFYPIKLFFGFNLAFGIMNLIIFGGMIAMLIETKKEARKEALKEIDFEPDFNLEEKEG